MKQSLHRFLFTHQYLLAGILFTGIAGSIFHFLFDWYNGSVLVALFAPVNESVWEHMKLLFFPVLMYSLWEYAKRDVTLALFLPSRTGSLLAGLFSIPLLFFSYTALLGKNVIWADLLIYLISILITYVGSFLLERLGRAFQSSGQKRQSAFPWSCAGVLLSLLLLGLLLFLFASFTFSPPEHPLFLDPVTGTYGI